MRNIKSEINKLIDKDVGNNTLKPLQPAQSIPATVGVAISGSLSTSSGSGIASPLTEVSRQTKTIAVNVPSGSVTVDIDVITELTMQDAAGRSVVFKFTPPK